MEYQAKWGAKGFLTSTTKLVPLADFKATMAVKSETQTDSSGADKTVVKGKELEVVTFNTQYMTAAGVDPWEQVEEWRSLLGKSNHLYIGGKRFGLNKFMLKSVEVSDTFLTPTGVFIGLKVTITLQEDSNAKSTPKTTTTTTPSTKPKTTTYTTSTGTTIINHDDAAQSTKVSSTTAEERRNSTSWWDKVSNTVKNAVAATKAGASTADRETVAIEMGSREESQGTGDYIEYAGRLYEVIRYDYGDKSWPIIIYAGKELGVFKATICDASGKPK